MTLNKHILPSPPGYSLKAPSLQHRKCSRYYINYVCHSSSLYTSAQCGDWVRVRSVVTGLTFWRSSLSARRAATSPIRYIPKMRHTVERTTKFPVSPNLLNSVQTLSKSMGFGATKMFPPNAERCVHKQCTFPSTCFHPAFKGTNLTCTLLG